MTFLSELKGPALLAHFASCGFLRIEPPILQPAKVFLDQAGEDIRGRLYLTSDAGGAELCLRPEYTVPVCREFLALEDAVRADYCYLGPVFRLRPGAIGEFLQAGVESFGRTDLEAADADILATAVEACAAAGSGDLALSIGDAQLFSGFLKSLELTPAWMRRIHNALTLGRPLAAILGESAADNQNSDHSGVLAALAGADKQGAKALVEDLLSIAGISSVGGRSVGEIAERFLEQAENQGAGGLEPRQRALIERFIALEGDPDAVVAALRKLAKSEGLDLNALIDPFETRIHFMAARGLDPGAIRFSSRLSMRLNYYTGFVFEAHRPADGADKPLVRGGRYDKLLSFLGSRTPISAIGAAIWIERLKAQP